MIWYEREWSQWAQMIASDPKMIPRWSQMILSDPKVITSNWFRTIPDHRSWANMRPDGPRGSQMILDDAIWSQMSSDDPRWFQMIPDDPSDPVSQSTKLSQMRPDDHRCSRTSPDDAMWSEMVPGTLVRDLLVLTIPAALSWSSYSVWPSRRHVPGNFGPCGSLKWSRAKKLLKNYSKTTTPKLL